MAKPTLALIPASQGSKLFSVLPSSGVGDFDFSRGTIATRINSEGLIENVVSGQSRLSYPLIDGKVVGCPHHILEPERANLQVNSEEFDNALWNKTRASITPNDAISPSGLLNADKLEGTGSTSSYLYDGVEVVSGSVYTISVFVKYIDISEFVIVNFTQSGNAYFNIENGTVISNFGTMTEPKIENYGNGWYRCSAKFTANATQGVAYGPYLNNAINKSVHIWGAQFELGDYLTSYIPTTTNIVTRSAESANGAGDAATFNDSEGVFMAEFSSNNQDVRWIALGSNSSNRLLFGSSGGNIRSYNNIGGTLITYQSTIDSTNNNKVAIKYKSGDTNFYINGFKAFESNSAFTVSTPFDEIQFKNLSGDTQNFYGKTKQLQYYNSALTDSELEQLTSWISFTDMANGQLYTIE